jgi:hypothetical protein
MTSSITCFALAFLALVGTAILFFVLDIRGIVGELTGKTATAAIAKIREEGAYRQQKGRSLASIVGTADPHHDLGGDWVNAGRANQVPMMIQETADQQEHESVLPFDRSEDRTGLLSDLSEQETGFLGRKEES